MSSNENGSHTIVILLVEDNPGDVRLIIEAMREAKLDNYINVVEDGVEAMQFLRREGRFGDAPRPDLILLDLNLPKKDGRAVLAEVKTDPVLRRIPVVVLTTSNAEEDVLRAYDLHANCYITKPVDMEQFMKIVAQIDEFWIRVVTLPKG
jgi:chemotaxis family two-component system response regulator Rcp1